MRKSRLNNVKQERLIEHFVAGTTARTAAALVDVNKTTAAFYFHRLCQIIYDTVEIDTVFTGEVEVDESYFGDRRKAKGEAYVTNKRSIQTFIRHNRRISAIYPSMIE